MVAPATGAPATRPLTEIAARLRPAPALLPAVLALIAFVVLFANPAQGLWREMLDNPDAGHGLLLIPVALWLMWRSGILAEAAPAPWSGLTILLGAVLLRALGSLAAEFFTQRFAIWLALIGGIVFGFGWRQLRHWWLPLTLLMLSIPLPALITNKLAIPLQFRASKMGTALIAWRDIPVRSAGNVIVIAGPDGGPALRLFVAEACSGLRSLTALIAIGVMIGGMYLATLPSRLLLLLLAVPVAVVINSVRIFLTAFLMYFVDPALGRGFMHASEGWALFLLSLLILAAIGTVIRLVERRLTDRPIPYA